MGLLRRRSARSSEALPAAVPAGAARELPPGTSAEAAVAAAPREAPSVTRFPSSKHPDVVFHGSMPFARNTVSAPMGVDAAQAAGKSYGRVVRRNRDGTTTTLRASAAHGGGFTSESSSDQSPEVDEQSDDEFSDEPTTQNRELPSNDDLGEVAPGAGPGERQKQQQARGRSWWRRMLTRKKAQPESGSDANPRRKKRLNWFRFKQQHAMESDSSIESSDEDGAGGDAAKGSVDDDSASASSGGSAAGRNEVEPRSELARAAAPVVPADLPRAATGRIIHRSRDQRQRLRHFRGDSDTSSGTESTETTESDADDASSTSSSSSKNDTEPERDRREETEPEAASRADLSASRALQSIFQQVRRDSSSSSSSAGSAKQGSDADGSTHRSSTSAGDDIDDLLGATSGTWAPEMKPAAVPALRDAFARAEEVDPHHPTKRAPKREPSTFESFLERVKAWGSTDEVADSATSAAPVVALREQRNDSDADSVSSARSRLSISGESSGDDDDLPAGGAHEWDSFSLRPAPAAQQSAEPAGPLRPLQSTSARDSDSDDTEDTEEEDSGDDSDGNATGRHEKQGESTSGIASLFSRVFS